MVGFLLRRLVAAVVLLFLVLTLTFFLIRLVPGDPALLFEDPRIPREHQEHLRRIYGLDRPLLEQYGTWLSAVVRGDWGISFAHQRPVIGVLAEALPATFLLAATALVIDFGLGLLLGVAAARSQGSFKDHLIRVGSLLLYSLPIFWLGLMAILVFAYLWPLFPPGHMHSVGAHELGLARRVMDLTHHLALPALVLGLAGSGGTTRYVRNSLLEVLRQDYIRTARAKGLSETRVFWIHGLRNGLVPVLQLFGLALPALLNGSLIVEVVFAWPGVGRVTYNAILTRDYPLILAATALSGALVVAGNLLADLLHASADPRVRHG